LKKVIKNKQTRSRKMAHKIAADKCVACGCCKDACPAEAIAEGAPYTIDADKCVDCGACAAQCPSEAISAE
jgi:NAD-dependent dihydropyrimidine dehydrogenase PreA subunit